MGPIDQKLNVFKGFQGLPEGAGLPHAVAASLTCKENWKLR